MKAPPALVAIIVYHIDEEEAKEFVVAIGDEKHVSQATADLLINAGKVHWVQKRPNLVYVKGPCQTYWAEVAKKSTKKSINDSMYSLCFRN